MMSSVSRRAEGEPRFASQGVVAANNERMVGGLSACIWSSTSSTLPTVSIRLRLLVVVTALSAACLPGFAERAPLTAVVVDDFSDVAIAQRYRHEGGSWRVLDGGLHTVGDRNQPLWSNVVLPENVRIEFTSVSSTSAVDMKVEIFGDGVRHESGYIAIVGGWNNTLTVLARLDEHEPSRATKRTRFEAGRRYRWRIERTDGHTIKLFVDDELQVAYDDKVPLYGPRNNRFAFSGWESEVVFDDLKITPVASAGAPPGSPSAPR